MQFNQHFGKTLLALSLCVVAALFVHIQTTYAATYWSGNVEVDGSGYFETRSFYVPKTKVNLRGTKWATKTVSIKIQLIRESDDKVVGSCLGNAYPSKSSLKCGPWSTPNGGNYYLKFTNQTSKSTLYINPYSLTN
jgi:hypothetical protein